MSFKVQWITALDNLKFVQANFDKLNDAQRQLRIKEIGLFMEGALESFFETAEDATVEVSEMVVVQMAVQIYQKLAAMVTTLSPDKSSALQVQEMLNIQL